ncbi:MAG: hypothetical protein M9894_13130 [Planctomycetes bacterium]|nr:hypothetical protein [Planctomycetota bacterium]
MHPGKHFGAVVAALLLVAPACRDGARRSREALVVLGSVDLSGSEAGELAFDPGRRALYVAGGFGQLGLLRVDVSDPASPTALPFASGYGAGVAVDAATGRVATTDAYGGTLALFEPGGALLTRTALTGCGGLFAAGPGRFAVSTQCVDRLTVCDGTTGAVQVEVPTAGVAGELVFNAATGRYYQNRTPRAGGAVEALVLTPGPGGGLVASDLGLQGLVVAADPATNRVFLVDLAAPSAGLVALDGDTHAVVARPGLVDRARVAVAGAARRLFVSGVTDDVVRLVDADALTVVDAVDMLAATGHATANKPIVSDGERAYVIGRAGTHQRLFILGRRR